MTPDDCASNPCANGGNCTDNIISYTCQGGYGYKGDNCETYICPEVNPCQNGGTCHDGINSFPCECVAGYEGSSCENSELNVKLLWGVLVLLKFSKILCVPDF